MLVGARPIAHGDGETAARNPHDRRVAEVRGEPLGIDRRIWISQDVADVATKIEDVFSAPVRVAELRGEIRELAKSGGSECHTL